MSQGSSNNARLVTEDRRGLLQVTVWANQTEQGDRHNVTLRRSYKTGDEWKETKMSLPLNDLLQAARLLEWANDRAYADIAHQKQSATSQSSGSPLSGTQPATGSAAVAGSAAGDAPF